MSKRDQSIYVIIIVYNIVSDHLWTSSFFFLSLHEIIKSLCLCLTFRCSCGVSSTVWGSDEKLRIYLLLPADAPPLQVCDGTPGNDRNQHAASWSFSDASWVWKHSEKHRFLCFNVDLYLTVCQCSDDRIVTMFRNRSAHVWCCRSAHAAETSKVKNECLQFPLPKSWVSRWKASSTHTLPVIAQLITQHTLMIVYTHTHTLVTREAPELHCSSNSFYCSYLRRI